MPEAASNIGITRAGARCVTKPSSTAWCRLAACSPAFATASPRTSAKTQLTKTKVLAAVVQLLEKTLIRVGNVEYARTNGSFGLTTLRDRHVKVRGGSVQFQFTGKSGVKQVVVLSDARLARIVKRCQDLPGQELFQYLDEQGKRRTVNSADVNAYLREITGGDYTAKDFRTWAGTLLACDELRASAASAGDAPSSQRAVKSIVVKAIESVAGHLGNTPAVCRGSYIHPAVFAAHADGRLAKMSGGATPSSARSLRLQKPPCSRCCPPASRCRISSLRPSEPLPRTSEPGAARRETLATDRRVLAAPVRRGYDSAA